MKKIYQFSMKSFIDYPKNSCFPIENIPFGVF